MLAAVASVVGLVLQLKPKAVYAYSVREFLSRDVHEREVRVSGQLVPGTLCRVPNTCRYRFALSDSARASDQTSDTPTLAIRYDACHLPDTVRDLPGYDLSLAVQGEACRQCHDFRATQVIAKCGGKYEAAAYAAAPPAPPLPLCARGPDL